MEIRKGKLEEAGGTRPSAGRPRYRKEGKKGAAVLRPYKGGDVGRRRLGEPAATNEGTMFRLLPGICDIVHLQKSGGAASRSGRVRQGER